MNSVTDLVQIKTNVAFTSVGVVVLLLVGLLFCVMVNVAIARGRRGVTALPSDSPRRLSSPSPFGGFQFVREFAWLAVPFVVIASFGMTTDPRVFLSGWGLSTKSVALVQPSPPLKTLGFESNHIPVSTVSTNDTSARPAWVDQVRVVEGDCEQIVLTSQQYSTREEAERELRFAAVRLVEEDLRRLQSGPFHPASWRPAVEDVIAHAVKERYDDVAERDFGSFTHPMHRVSWQVELSPRVRTEFMPTWRRAVISFRILFVAAVASLLAMAASASVMYFRLDSLTQGQSRGGLKLLAGTLVVVWWVLVAVAFSQEHWW